MDQVNRFLRSGAEDDAKSAVLAAAGEPQYEAALRFAADYWAGPNWRDRFRDLDDQLDPSDHDRATSFGDDLVVLRHGGAHLTWRY